MAFLSTARRDSAALKLPADTALRSCLWIEVLAMTLSSLTSEWLFPEGPQPAHQPLPTYWGAQATPAQSPRLAQRVAA